MTREQIEKLTLENTGMTAQQVTEIRNRIYQETGQVPETAPPDIVARITQEVINPVNVPVTGGIFSNPQEAMRNTTGNTGIAGHLISTVTRKPIPNMVLNRGVNLKTNSMGKDFTELNMLALTKDDPGTENNASKYSDWGGIVAIIITLILLYLLATNK